MAGPQWWLNSSWKNKPSVPSFGHPSHHGPHHGCCSAGRSNPLNMEMTILQDPAGLFLIPVPAPWCSLMPS